MKNSLDKRRSSIATLLASKPQLSFISAWSRLKTSWMVLLAKSILLGVIIFSSTGILLLKFTRPVQAMSDSRIKSAAIIDSYVNGGFRSITSDPAAEMVAGALQSAGVDGVHHWTTDDFARHCTRTGALNDKDGPVTGDYYLFFNAQPKLQVGLMVSSSQIVTWDAASAKTVLVERSLLDGSVPANPQDPKLIASPGFLPPQSAICRLPVQFWPGGYDDRTIAPGKVAIADSQHIASQMQFAAAHPRDADFSFLHQAIKAITKPFTQASQALLSATGWLFIALPTVFKLMGPPGWSILAGWWLLSRSFDGRWLHKALTSFLVGVAFVAFPGFTSILLAAYFAGALANKMQLPALGTIGNVVTSGLYGGVSFVVDVLTGVTDSDHVSLLQVGAALAGDFLWVAKPLGVGAKTFAVAEKFGEETINVVDGINGVLTAKPSVISGILEKAVGGPKLPAAFTKGTDLVSSFNWRPGTLTSEIVDKLSYLGNYTLANPEKLQQLLPHVDPDRIRAILDATLPKLDALNNASSAHTGAQFLGGALGGRFPQPIQPGPKLHPQTVPGLP